MHKFGLFFIPLMLFGAGNAAAVPVLELFTSQSCSSCPPADALMKRLAEEDPSLLVLSYHIDYWDRLNWKDTYSSTANTERQQHYAAALGSDVFTPQLVVNGRVSMIGSQEDNVRQAVALQKQAADGYTVSFTPDHNQLAVSITPAPPADAELWEVHYDRYAKTDVKSGENGGRVLESVNNVTYITKHPSASEVMMELPANQSAALLVQTAGQGRILGAGFYRQ